MDASAWITIAIAVGSSLLTYGAMRQKVLDLEVRIAKAEAALEAKDAARTADREAVIRLEEQMKHLQATLDRMDDKLTQALREKRAAPRRAS